MSEDIKHIKELLQIHRRNLKYLREITSRADTPGGSLALHNSIKLEEEKIRQLTTELKSLLAEYNLTELNDTHFDESAPGVDDKYYLYISEQKVNMIFGQMKYKIKSDIATSIGIDIDIDDDMYSRLRIVEKYLLDSERSGKVEDDKLYFRGIIDGYYFIWASENIVPSVLFTAKTEYTTLILGGSAKHLIGSEHSSYLLTSDTPLRIPPRGSGSGGNSISYFLESFDDVVSGITNISVIVLEPLLDPIFNPLSVIYREIQLSEAEREKNLLERMLGIANRSSYIGAEKLYGKIQNYMKPQRLEFMAVKLLSGNGLVGPVVVGSPIYVAIASV